MAVSWNRKWVSGSAVRKTSFLPDSCRFLAHRMNPEQFIWFAAVLFVSRFYNAFKAPASISMTFYPSLTFRLCVWGRDVLSEDLFTQIWTTFRFSWILLHFQSLMMFFSPLRINTMMLLMKSSRPFGKPPPPPKHTHTHGVMRLTVWCICPGGCVRRSQTSNWPWRTTSSLTTTPRGTCLRCQLASLFTCICLCIQFYFIDLRGKFHWMIIQCI